MKIEIYTEMKNFGIACFGRVILKNGEVVKVLEDETNVIDNRLEPHQRPYLHKRSGYTFKLYDEYDPERLDGIIEFNGLCFYMKVNWEQRIYLKWSRKDYWIQKDKNWMWVVGTLLAIAFFTLRQVVNT